MKITVKLRFKLQESIKDKETVLYIFKDTILSSATCTSVNGQQKISHQMHEL